MFTIRTILHPTDFSETAAAGFSLACDLARVHGARVLVTHIYPPPVCYGEAMARTQPDGYEEDLWRMLQKVHSSDPTVRVEHRLIEGDPIAEVLRLAEEESADLIVMGTRGRTGLARLFLGSVAEQVLRRAPCPVLTVRTAPAAEKIDAPAATEKSHQVVAAIGS